MKSISLIFPVLILLIWSLINYYVCSRVWHSLSINSSILLRVYVFFCVALFLLLPVTMLFRENIAPRLSMVLQILTYLWMVVILYAFFIILFFDLIRLINYIKPFYPEWVTSHYVMVKRGAFFAGTIIVGIILIVGNWRYNHPVPTRLELTTTKFLGEKGEINILFFSDLHLGSLTTTKRLQNYMDRVKSDHYDLVLIGGDLMDGDHQVWKERNFAGILQELHSANGTYVSLGNHEYYNGLKYSIDFIKAAGFHLLRDQYVLIGKDHEIMLVGRDDRTNNDRKRIAQIIPQSMETAPYTIVLDHQPGAIKEAEDAGADLLLCGHTHNGQIFPLTLFIHAMWEVAYGHEKKENMDVYVSSGLGLWGPPFRIGSRSEWVEITIKSIAN